MVERLRLTIISPSRRIRFSFRRKSPPSRRTQEGLVFQAATLREYPNAFSAEALFSQEIQQVSVDSICLGRGHAVRKARVGLQCAILEQLCRKWKGEAVENVMKLLASSVAFKEAHQTPG
jgi:hypothetical protein